ncbi:hypothetical protein FIV00_26055 [Labrenzia sp. THAF82]|nr:hypothetical protein FIV00_26055 [Labrenzia sp. THAF82]
MLPGRPGSSPAALFLLQKGAETISVVASTKLVIGLLAFSEVSVMIFSLTLELNCPVLAPALTRNDIIKALWQRLTQLPNHALR